MLGVIYAQRACALDFFGMKFQLLCEWLYVQQFVIKLQCNLFTPPPSTRHIRLENILHACICVCHAKPKLSMSYSTYKKGSHTAEGKGTNHLTQTHDLVYGGTECPAINGAPLAPVTQLLVVCSSTSDSGAWRVGGSQSVGAKRLV